jgi:hypothetical protein
MGSQHIAQARAAIQRSRRRAQIAEADADASGELLDVLLDLVADRVIDGMRDRGWIEFHHERPSATTNPQRSPEKTATATPTSDLGYTS